MQRKDRNTNSKKIMSAEMRRTALSLAVNSIILLFVYYGAMAINVPIISQIITIAYMLIFGGFLVAYIAYNRAFTRKNITHEMLPENWSTEQKDEYIADGSKRMEKSRWMLSVIIPFLVTIMADALYLFVWTGFLEPLFSNIP